MNKTYRDSQKHKVYAAEWLTWTVLDKEFTEPLSKEVGQKFIDHILKCDTPYMKVTVKQKIRGFGGAVANQKWNTGRTISTGMGGCTKAILVHELAHHLAGLHYGHNREFASKLLSLYKRFIGVTESQILRMAFVQYRVKYRLNRLKVR